MNHRLESVQRTARTVFRRKVYTIRLVPYVIADNGERVTMQPIAMDFPRLKTAVKSYHTADKYLSYAFNHHWFAQGIYIELELIEQ